MKNQRKYKAFSLIELIISIVVIGIVAVTLPVILQTTTSSMKTSAKEELFYQEFALLQLINSMYFDENNTKDDNFYKDLNATQGDDELQIYTYQDELNRIGKEDMNNNDLRSGSNLSVSHIGVDSGEDEHNESTFDDIDDYNNFEETLVSFGSVTLKVNVFYIDDNTDYSKSEINFNFNYSDIHHNSNIKLIKITANVDNQNIVLSYPAMNIGASKYFSLEEISK